MRTIFAVAAILSINAALPSFSDQAAALSSYRSRAEILAEASGPSVGGRDTALFAEANGPTAGGRDTALFAEGNGPSVGGRDTALFA